MLNRMSEGLNFQGQALVLRSERQRMIASNIANADTPGFVARDMNFAQALQAATRPGASATGTAALRQTSPAHLMGSVVSPAQAATTFALASQTSLDSNTVDMDRERASFADNAVKFEASLRFINGSVKTMLDAIRGQ